MKTLIFTVLFFSSVCYSQFKDSGEKVIFSIDNATQSRVKFSGGETSLEILIKKFEHIYVYRDSTERREKIISSKKFNGFFLKGGLVDMKKMIDLDQLELSHVAFTAGVSYVHSADTIIDPSIGFWTIRLSADFRRDNFNNFHSELSEPSREYPLTYTLSGGLTHYFPMNKKTFFSPSLSASWSPKTYNSSDLTSFAYTSSLSENIVNFEKVEGKYGKVDNDLSAGHLALSIPYFIKIDHKFIGKALTQVSIVPYGSTTMLRGIGPVYNSGLCIGLFPERFFSPLKTPSSNTVIKTKVNKQETTERYSNTNSLKFKSPTVLAIGCDYVFSSYTKASKPNFFLSGTFSF